MPLMPWLCSVLSVLAMQPFPKHLVGSEELEKKPVSGEFMMDETSAEEEIIEKEVDRVTWKELEDFRPAQETVPEEAPHPRFENTH